MATGSQNMTTYIAKQVIGDITNADWSGALLHSGKDGKSNSIDTWIFADDYGSASSNYGIRHNQTEDTIEFVGASIARTIIHLGKSEIVVSHLVGGADTWYTARTFTVGNTGKSVNGGADVSWSKDEILGGSGTTTFLRADKSWTNILTGSFYSTGSPGFQNVTAAGTWAYLQLKSGTLGWDIASVSSQNSGALDFRPHKSTNHGIMISQDGGLYFRNPATEGIYYAGSKSTTRMIRFLDNSSSTDGNGIIIGGAGYVGIGSGESGDQSYSGGGYSAGSETLVLSSDGDIRLLPTQQSGYNVAYETLVTTNGLWVGREGNTTREMDVGVRSGAGSLYLWSHAAVAGERGLWLPAHGSGGAYALVCADTNNVSYLQGHRIGIKNTDSTSGYGLSLYNGQYNGVPEYGMFFGGTGTFGKFGDVSADWATYFTMNRNDTRGWIFKSNGTAKNGSYNVASISGRGHFTGTLSPSSWIDGQRYTYAAYNIADYSNTGSYNPWMRATNTWSSGAENAKVGRWFSFGTLGTRFHWIGSTTTKTANSYDNVMTFDIANGALYANGLIQSGTGFADHYNGSATKLAYSQSGLAGSAISWMTCWNGYELRAISKAEVFNVVRDNGGDSRWVNVTGDTMTGNLSFSNSGTGFRGINYGTMGDNDQWRIGGAATAANAGYMELATGDDGNEPIYVRQYTGVFSTVKRTLTLLDGSGNTSFPGVVNAPAYTLNGAASTGTNYITGTAGRIFFRGNFHIDSLGSNATYINYYTANNVYMVSGSSQGKVGIGTNSPSEKLSVSGWVGTIGNTGWYSITHAGGWYMSDAKWIRSHNSKPVLIDIGTNNSYGIGGHRLALGLAGSSHTSIMFKGGDVMYGFAVNNDGNWYFGKRTSKSFESTSGDAYSYYGNATSILPMNNNAVTLGDSSHKWSHLYCQGRVYLDEWIQFSGTTGLYCPNTNGAHWYPNNASSYGTWVMQGSRGGYAGIQLGASTNYMTVMDDATNKGLFQEGQRWIFYYNRSTQRVGIRDSSTSGGWGIQCNGDTYITGAVYSGDNRGGKLRMVDNWLGFYSSANAGGTRYGYIQCDVNRMYFRKENSSSQTHYFDFGSAVYIAGELNTGGVRARGGMMALSEANSGNCAVWFVNSTNTESYWKAAVQSNKEAFVFYRYSGTTPNWRFAIYSNGTTATSSSRKIKHDIQDINFNTGLIIDRMKPVSYIVNGDTTNHTTYGFIYEDLVQVLPNVCVNSDGNVGIMYTTIIPILTKEIQNLRKRLAAVETELSYYRSKT